LADFKSLVHRFVNIEIAEMSAAYMKRDQELKVVGELKVPLISEHRPGYTMSASMNYNFEPGLLNP
jgi:hypothetical protein